jgi:ribonuclease P protein component
MIPGGLRFHGHNSLRFVYANGKAARCHIATIKYVTNPRRSKSRIAVVVSKKVLKSAVKRNRIRRRIYEYMRLSLPDFKVVHDIVVIVTSPEVYTLPAPELAEQMDQLLLQTELRPHHQ